MLRLAAEAVLARDGKDGGIDCSPFPPPDELRCARLVHGCGLSLWRIGYFCSILGLVLDQGVHREIVQVQAERQLH